MHRPSLQHRPIALLSIAAWIATGMPAMAQTPTDPPSFLLRPHCEEADIGNCEAFAVETPLTLQTDTLQAGDLLDIDVVLHNPDAKSIRRVRAWLSYDTNRLEGVSITPGTALPLVVPSEADFSAEQGLAKIGLAAETLFEPREKEILIARVIFRVRETPENVRVPLSFYDIQNTNAGHTYALATDSQDTNIIPGPLGSLLVRIASEQEQSSAATSAVQTSSAFSAMADTDGLSNAANQASSAAAGSELSLPGASFGALQVQNVRITSEGSAVYIAWSELRTPRLQGYNVYYGSQMGRYLQRRSLPKSATTITLRDLPEGTRYYVSVRAVSDTNEESAFSQEVGVEVGNPRTATAPLLNIPGSLNGDLTAPQNPLGTPGNSSTASVPGESGFSSTFALFFIVCAVIGTGFAFRRQCIALPATHHV